MFTASLHGFLLALGLILPLGPQNAFVLSQGGCQPSYRHALPVVLTASLCDTLLILLAVLGVSVAVMNLTWLRSVLVIGGVLFLLIMGWLSWRAAPSDDEAPAEARPPRRQIVLALVFSLGNPHAIIDTVGVIGTSSLAYTGEARVGFTAACIAVSWIWFALLAAAGRLLGHMALIRRQLNRISALVMWGSALYLGVTVPIS